MSRQEKQHEWGASGSGEQWFGWNAGKEKAGWLGRTQRANRGLPKALRGQVCLKTDTVRGTGTWVKHLHPQILYLQKYRAPIFGPFPEVSVSKATRHWQERRPPKGNQLLGRSGNQEKTKAENNQEFQKRKVSEVKEKICWKKGDI